MNTTSLSPSVTAYLRLSEGPDKTSAIDVFTPDAVVTDDGSTHRGRSAVLDWLAGTASAFTYSTTLLAAKESDGVAVVSSLIEGDFPGGRATLQSRFELAPDGLIRSLTISA